MLVFPSTYRPRKKKKSSASRSFSATSSTYIPDSSTTVHQGPTKTEQKFEEVQRKRVRGQFLALTIYQMREQARKEASKSHTDKVDSFNAYLDSLSEHHDMPKIGPG